MIAHFPSEPRDGSRLAGAALAGMTCKLSVRSLSAGHRLLELLVGLLQEFVAFVWIGGYVQQSDRGEDRETQ